MGVGCSSERTVAAVRAEGGGRVERCLTYLLPVVRAHTSTGTVPVTVVLDYQPVQYWYWLKDYSSNSTGLVQP
jgi:hypothetical protein